MEQSSRQKTETVLRELHISDPVLLGFGGEGYVYEYGNDVLKIYTGNTDIRYLEELRSFQKFLAKQHFSFAVPQIFTIGEIDGIAYSVEKRLSGMPIDKKAIGLDTVGRQRAYLNYYRAIREVNAVALPDKQYGQIIKTRESVTAESWTGYLIRLLERKAGTVPNNTKSAISDFDAKVDKLKILIGRYLHRTEKHLVHGDYYLNNVLLNDDLSVAAVLDFSMHAAVGDPRLDIAGVLTWNGIDPHIRPEDYGFLSDIAKKDYGDDIGMIVSLYLLFSSFYFADMDDPSFSIKNLNDDSLWDMVNG